MLLRTRRYQWVNQAAEWEIVSDDWPALASASAASAALRESNAQFVRDIELESVLNRFRLTSLQHFQLQERGPLPVRLARRAAAGKYRHGSRDDARGAASNGRPRLFPASRRASSSRIRRSMPSPSTSAWTMARRARAT